MYHKHRITEQNNNRTSNISFCLLKFLFALILLDSEPRDSYTHPGNWSQLA